MNSFRSGHSSHGRSWSLPPEPLESVSELLVAAFDRAAIERINAMSQLRFVWALLHNVVDRLALADTRLAQA